MSVDVDERVRPGESAQQYVRRLAVEKSARAWDAVSGFSRTPASPPEGGHYVVLAADTAVVVDDDILGKPRDDHDARRMLEQLSGRDHRVITGFSLRTGSAEHGGVESTDVAFAPLSGDDLAWYVASGEGLDKAGGYAIQGLASRFIPRISGSYSNVVGLPVARVAALLHQLGCRP
jgi:septum formation protein